MRIFICEADILQGSSFAIQLSLGVRDWLESCCFLTRAVALGKPLGPSGPPSLLLCRRCVITSALQGEAYIR